MFRGILFQPFNNWMEGAKEDLVDMFIVHTMAEIQVSKALKQWQEYLFYFVYKMANISYHTNEWNFLFVITISVQSNFASVYVVQYWFKSSQVSE